MEQILELDQELFLFLNSLGTPAWDQFWNTLTNKWTSIPLYLVLIYLLYRSMGSKALLITLVLVALMITATDQLANVFKHGFQRARPCGQEGVMEYGRFVAVRCGRYGYFSAHAASSTAVVVFIGAILRSRYTWMVYFLVLWALMVSYSRIYVGVHYPLDIFTGMAIGAGLGFLFYKLRLFLVTRYVQPSP